MGDIKTMLVTRYFINTYVGYLNQHTYSANDIGTQHITTHKCAIQEQKTVPTKGFYTNTSSATSTQSERKSVRVGTMSAASTH
jgi:hypothetical protein